MWLVHGQVSIASARTGESPEKSNEITAIPALLEVLALSGCIITIDAMGTQTAIVQNYIANADYVLALKANHPKLYGQIKDWFEQAQAQNFAGIEVSRTNTLKAVITGLKSVKSSVSRCPTCPCYINKLVD